MPVFEAWIEKNMRRSTRQRGFTQRSQGYELLWDNEVNDDGDFVHFALMAEFEPVKTEEALSDPKWICPMKEELESIENNNTWELVDLQDGKKPIGVRWVFKVKENHKSEIIKHKTRLVSKGLLQRKGIAFEEVFAKIARIETIRLVVGIANNNNWLIYQMDVKSTFLNGPLEEEVYVKQSPWFSCEKIRAKVIQV